MAEYVVWERNDGLIDCTVRMPRDWTTPSGEVTFTHLKTFAEWDAETVAFIKSARKEKELKRRRMAV